MLKAQHSIPAALLLAAVTILAPPRAAADVVHSDDVIIRGKACVGGTDCVDGRPFAGDLELVSFTPEIIFFDSSSGEDDWEIQASSDDLRFRNHVDGGSTATVVTFNGGAPENSLVIDSSGWVGMGTSTPGQELHLAFSSPTIRFEDTNGSQIWDLIGNEAGFFVRDRTAGFVDRFWIEPGTGNVGIGTTSPEVKLHVMGETKIEGDLSVLSSGRAKEILSPASASEVLAALEGLPIVTWRYKEDSGGSVHLGPTSEAFHAAFGLGADKEHLSLVDTAGVAMASIQELARLVEAQRREIAELRSERRDLVRRVELLESSTAR